MKRIFFLFSWWIFCGGCTYKYFTYDYEGYLDNKKISTINIDSSYRLYTRVICRQLPEKGHYNGPSFRKRPLAEANWCNCQGSETNLEVIEKEYLLVSNAKKNVIQITPYPPYEDGDTLLFNHAAFKNPVFVNLWWANRFHFGEICEDGRVINFVPVKGKYKQDTWQVSWAGGASGDDEMTIETATFDQTNRIGSWRFEKKNRPTSAIFSPKTVYKKQKHILFGFQQRTDVPGFSTSKNTDYLAFLLADNSIHYYEDENGINVFFYVKDATNKKGKKIIAVDFEAKNAPYKPK